MKIRKITSLTAALSFIFMVLTSIVLYVVPQGRVAYWADWRFWGFTKTDWGNLHITLGLLFLISLFLHIYYNWNPLISYLKDKKRNLKVLTVEFNVSLAITILFCLGALFSVPPASWVIDANTWFKDKGSAKYGEPPYGHAELSSLKTFGKKMEIDVEKAMDLLKKAGYDVKSPDETLESISRSRKVPPQQVFEIIKPAMASTPKQGIAGKMPDSPPPGTGKLTLADLCTQYGLNMKDVVRHLKGANIAASEEMTLKKIAEDNNISPTDVYEAVRTINDN